ncbi:cation transporting ATPase C-terminal domain-containing protein [Roseovarius indicus]|uniref:cation transporting ATPase C-terminal domain-containing protein n=1 Tax=Roseovarius indicus TaxID=540747 RepID=UPI00405926F5
MTKLAAVVVLRTRRSAFCSHPGPMMLWSTMVVLGLNFAIAWHRPISAAFGFVPLPPSKLAAIAAILACYIVANETVKDWFHRARRASGMSPASGARLS